jgi:maleylacetoacetate isomerase
VRIALGYKAVAYESVPVNLVAGAQKEPAYREQNPIGHVPTLTVDGVAYTESLAIMELLDELYPEPPLLPKKAHERARVRALAETVNAGIQPLQNTSVLEFLAYEAPQRTAWLRHWISRGLEAFEAQMRRNEEEGVKGPFAYGATPSMADCCLVPQLYAARRFGVDLSSLPRIVRADAEAAKLPFVAAAQPEAQADAKL